MFVVKQAEEAQHKLASYPNEVRGKLEGLRSLILESAEELEGIEEVEEVLKWGELSYLTKGGSTIRIAWSAKNPNRYGLYFNCNTRLVATFREVFGDLFNYEKNRAIHFGLDASLPESELKKCIQLAFQYHQLKNKPLLGM